MNDAPIHIDDVERAVGGRDLVDGTKEWIGGADEFVLMIGVGELGYAGNFVDLGATNESADGFGKDEVSAQVCGKSITAKDVGTTRRREVVQGVVLAQLPDAALGVGDIGGGPNGFVAIDLFVFEFEVTVERVGLEMHGTGFFAGIDVPDAP